MCTYQRRTFAGGKKPLCMSKPNTPSLGGRLPCLPPLEGKKKTYLLGRRKTVLLGLGTFSNKQMFQILLNNSANITPKGVLLFGSMVRLSQMLMCCFDPMEFTGLRDSHQCLSSRVLRTCLNDRHLTPSCAKGKTVEPETTCLKAHRNKSILNCLEPN